MCTAISVNTPTHYFGRTLDWDSEYPCEVVITPRHFPLGHNDKIKNSHHLAIIGMAYVRDGYPLYFDGVNEKGLCMAGLNFVGNALYAKAKGKEAEVPQYELIPYILSRCKTAKEAKHLINRIRITDTAFSEDLPCAQLHWIIADKSTSLTLEITAEGTDVYDNPVGILTNNPPFPAQLENLKNYAYLSPDEKDYLTIPAHFTRGTGAVGLPGDWSSPSRFVRAAFTANHSVWSKSESPKVSNFFRTIEAVNIPMGCMKIGNGFEHTQYTCCINAEKTIYHYTTYHNHRITAVRMHNALVNSSTLSTYPLNTKEDILFKK